MEIKASGEENGVVAKGRPCQPELTDLFGILQGPWPGGEDRGQQILGEAHGPHPALLL